MNAQTHFGTPEVQYSPLITSTCTYTYTYVHVYTYTYVIEMGGGMCRAHINFK